MRHRLFLGQNCSFPCPVPLTGFGVTSKAIGLDQKPWKIRIFEAHLLHVICFPEKESYVNFCARVSWDPCILATCVCRSLGPGSAAGKRQKTGSKRKNIGECSEPSGQPLRSLRSPRFFFAHTNFFSFSQCGARSQASQAMSVDISSPVFTLTKWEEGRSRWTVSEKRKCVLWGLGRNKKEARGGP